MTRSNKWQLEPFEFALSDGAWVSVCDTGVLCLDPASGAGDQPGGCKHIVLSCGIHGNETTPIEICNQLLRRLLCGELSARHRVLFLFGNSAAMNLGLREVEENMNRLFSGAHSKGEGLCNRERIRAMRLEQYVSSFFADPARRRYHYDLHTAIRGSRTARRSLSTHSPTSGPTAANRCSYSAPAGYALFCFLPARPPPLATTARASMGPTPSR